MNRHAIVDQNGLVVSVVIWPDASFMEPAGYKSIPHDSVKVGDRHDGQKFVKPDGSLR